jgi:hypothetical protein
MLSQQLSGINIVAFYSSTIFKTAGYSNQQALLASWGFAAITFVFAIPAWYTIDTFGRRTLLLWAFPFMAICLFVTGGVYGLPVDSSARLPLIVTFVYIFVALFVNSTRTDESSLLISIFFTDMDHQSVPHLQFWLERSSHFLTEKLEVLGAFSSIIYSAQSWVRSMDFLTMVY